MPVPYRHLYYSEFKETARAAGLDLTELEALQAKSKEAYLAYCAASNARRALAEKLLAENYDAIRPKLRPCHQKRFDEARQRDPQNWADGKVADMGLEY
jgi:hypothetical protein